MQVDISNASGRIFTPSFGLLCASAVLFFASFNMIIPELPAYLTRLGGAEYKGLIISLFTVTAMISRPFSGRLADRIGRVPVIMVGSAVCLICAIIYPVLSGVWGFFVLRLVHGFSTGFTPTGQTAYVSDIVPPSRRGEAMGIIGTAGMLGMAGGPALGGLLSEYWGLNAVFYCSSAFAFLSLSILLNLRETLAQKQPFQVAHLRVGKDDLFEARVLTPCVVMVLCAYAYGAVFTLLPDLGMHVGIKNKGLLFTALTLSSLAVRLIGGKASDRWGRRPVLQISTGVIVIAMIAMAFAGTPQQLFTSIVLYGMAQGTTSPTLLAWATDLSPAERKGRGVASLYMAMELGIGVGAFASGLLYGNVPSRFPSAFLICAVFAGSAFLYLLATRFRAARQAV